MAWWQLSPQNPKDKREARSSLTQKIFECWAVPMILVESYGFWCGQILGHMSYEHMES